VGRGQGSGLGKTAGRGGKGQKARTGNMHFEGFEGGQMPLVRRIPKRGFTNPYKQPAQVVNVRHLDQLAEGVEVTPDTLFGAGLVRRPDRPIKLLGMGDVQRKFAVKGVTVSASARAKIEQAGGTIAS
jgi:large subunit ribosomal protein L15